MPCATSFHYRACREKLGATLGQVFRKCFKYVLVLCLLERYSYRVALAAMAVFKTCHVGGREFESRTSRHLTSSGAYGLLFLFQAREPARRAKRGGQKTTRYAGARRRLRPCVKTPPVGIRYGCSSRISPERRPFWQTRHTACRTRSGCASTTSCSHRSIGAN